MLSCLAIVGCIGSRSTDDPQAVVRQYLEAIYAGRASTAWDMHSARTNQGENYDDFAEVVRIAAQTAGAARIQHMETKRNDGAAASVEVVQRLADRESTYTFELVREDGRWKIDNPRRQFRG